jgi:ABC-type antimicrobial peptide transport system permease subunit
VGVYGLVSYRVHLGARDLSLRMALGAPARSVLALVMRHGLGLALVGVGGGLAAALALTRFMRSLLFEVGAVDGPTYVAVAFGLVLTALMACWIPARRATRLSPLEVINGH